jgi:hypothetical protein
LKDLSESCGRNLLPILPPRRSLVFSRDIISAENPSREIRVMPIERFFDTNVLLYGYDLDAPEKRLVAKSLIETVW